MEIIDPHFTVRGTSTGGKFPGVRRESQIVMNRRHANERQSFPVAVEPSELRVCLGSGGGLINQNPILRCVKKRVEGSLLNLLDNSAGCARQLSCSWVKGLSDYVRATTIKQEA